MIKFSAPGYIAHFKLIRIFIELQEAHPEIFIENRKLDSAYDLPGGLIWNGGRYSETKGNMLYDPYIIYDFYLSHNFNIRHTCTNYFLIPEFFNDFQCNTWISHCERKGNSVILRTKEFANYIKQTYPQYSIIYSTTLGPQDIETINEMSKEDMVVLDYTYNKNLYYIQQLQNPKNIEILCAESCVPHCPNRQQHYEIISKEVLNVYGQESFLCPYNSDRKMNFYRDALDKPFALNNEDIDKYYNEYGIENFKLSGRTTPPYYLLEVLCYYLIKPEFRDEIRLDILHKIW